MNNLERCRRQVKLSLNKRDENGRVLMWLFDSIELCKGLSKLFASRKGSKIMFEEALNGEQFVESLINLELVNRSFFVKESIQRCLVELIRWSVEFDDQFYVFSAVCAMLWVRNKQTQIINQTSAKWWCIKWGKINNRWTISRFKL